jgi:hypothetical protein
MSGIGWGFGLGNELQVLKLNMNGLEIRVTHG